MSRGTIAMGMFDNYPQPEGYIPDNRVKDVCMEDEDTIIVNGTTVHVFRLNFSYSELCSSFEAIYESGLDAGFSVKSTDLGGPFSIDEEDGHTFITITLTPEMTAPFKPIRDAYAQMRLTMKDGTTIYGDMNKLRVIDTLGR